MKNKHCLGLWLFSVLASIIFILIGADYKWGVVPGLKTVDATTAIILVVIGLIGLASAAMAKCCCRNDKTQAGDSGQAQK